jgi:hypothetical protein
LNVVPVTQPPRAGSHGIIGYVSGEIPLRVPDSEFRVSKGRRGSAATGVCTRRRFCKPPGNAPRECESLRRLQFSIFRGRMGRLKNSGEAHAQDARWGFCLLRSPFVCFQHGGARLRRAVTADAGGASKASISGKLGLEVETHCVRLAPLESGLDGVSPHPVWISPTGCHALDLYMAIHRCA